jgi:hypothetical protein
VPCKKSRLDVSAASNLARRDLRPNLGIDVAARQTKDRADVSVGGSQPSGYLQHSTTGRNRFLTLIVSMSLRLVIPRRVGSTRARFRFANRGPSWPKGVSTEGFTPLDCAQFFAYHQTLPTTAKCPNTTERSSETLHDKVSMGSVTLRSTSSYVLDSACIESFAKTTPQPWTWNAGISFCRHYLERCPQAPVSLTRPCLDSRFSGNGESSTVLNPSPRNVAGNVASTGIEGLIRVGTSGRYVLDFPNGYNRVPIAARPLARSAKPVSSHT